MKLPKDATPSKRRTVARDSRSFTMISSATLAAAARVTEYAARRPVVLHLSAATPAWPAVDDPLAAKADAPGVESESGDMHPQGGSLAQRIISA
jgi:hypothetical protein